MNAVTMTPVATGRRVQLAGVSKKFVSPDGQTVPAVDSVDLLVPSRQFVAIVGPSGSGKSTLLRLVGGLLPLDDGQVFVDGASPRPGFGIGVAFQNFRLMPWRSVAGNVEFALEAMAMPRHERRERVAAHLERVGLAAWARHYPSQLSGGMRQRVALARALVTQPQLLLLDEPFGSLDAQTRELMQEDLLSLFESERPTVLFVTHSVDEALLLADRVLVMGAGRVLDDVAVDLPRPRSTEALHGIAGYASLRSRVWDHIRRLVLSDPGSAFFGRGRPGF